MDKKLVGLSALLMISFLAFTAYVFFSGSLNTLTRASVANNVVSEQNSLIFAWPLTAPADGSTKSEITVFVRNSEGAGLEGHSVRVESTVGTIAPQTLMSDADGKAMFSLTSDQPDSPNLRLRLTIRN